MQAPRPAHGGRGAGRRQSCAESTGRGDGGAGRRQSRAGSAGRRRAAQGDGRAARGARGGATAAQGNGRAAREARGGTATRRRRGSGRSRRWASFAPRFSSAAEKTRCQNAGEQARAGENPSYCSGLRPSCQGRCPSKFCRASPLRGRRGQKRERRAGEKSKQKRKKRRQGKHETHAEQTRRQKEQPAGNFYPLRAASLPIFFYAVCGLAYRRLRIFSLFLHFFARTGVTSPRPQRSF